jgi:ribosomal-protein-alanine N-acetyltransferase
MTLLTDTILLKELEIKAIPGIHRLHSIPAVDKYNTLGIPTSIQQTEDLVHNWLRAQNAVPRTSYIFTLEHPETTEFVGLIALNLDKPAYRKAEVWYKIHPAHWRAGYASTALRRLLLFGFKELRLHRIEAGCAVDNVGSIKVLEMAGMIREGRKRKVLPIRGEWIDNFIYAILEDDAVI